MSVNSSLTLWRNNPKGGAFSPSDLSGLELWLKADAGVLTDVDGVYEWQDQSGNGNDFTQSTGSKKPALTAAFQNSLPAVQFDGVDDELTRTGIDITSGYSVFLVLGAAENAYITGANDGGSADLIQRNISRPRFKADNDSAVWGASSWPDSSPHLIEFHSPGTFESDTVCWFDGVSLGIAPGSLGDEPWALGILGAYASGLGNSASDHCEWLLYSQEITGTDLTDARTYLNDRWAIY